MKKIITLIVLLLTVSVFSQRKLSVDKIQVTKLTFGNVTDSLVVVDNKGRFNYFPKSYVISGLQTQVNALSTDVVNNTSNINANAISITSNIGSINNNTSDISQLLTDVSSKADLNNSSQNIVANSYTGDGVNVSNVDAITLGGESKLNFSKRIDLTGQLQTAAYRKSVIALCELTNTNAELDSYSSGTMVFHRRNGFSTSSIVNLDFNIEKRFNTEGFNYNYTIKGDNSLIDNIRFVRFDYLGVKYGGIEVNFTAANHNNIVFNGQSNFDIFGLDYYNTQTSTAINTEVNNSIDEINAFNFDGFKSNGADVFTSSNLTAGSGVTITEDVSGNYEISASSTGGVSLLASNTTELQTTTTGSDDTVFTYTIPANTLKVGDILNIRVAGSDNGVGTRQLKFSLDGVGLSVVSPFFTNGSAAAFTTDIELLVTDVDKIAKSSVFNSNTYVPNNNSRSQNSYGVNILNKDIALDLDFIVKLRNDNNGDLKINYLTIKHIKN